MELPIELCQWLIQNSVLTEQCIATQDEKKALLNDDASKQLEIGIKIPLLLRMIQHQVLILFCNLEPRKQKAND